MPASLREVVDALHRIAPPELAAPWDNVGLLVEAPDRGLVHRCLLTIDLTERVLDEALAAECELVVAYHPPLFAPLRRLLADDPRQRVLLRAIAGGVSIHSPHTALDAAPGGVNDWLCDGLGAGERRGLAEPDSTVPIGRALTLAAPAPLAELVARIKRHLGLAHVRVASAPAHAAGQPIREVALCAGSGGAVLTGASADLLLTGELRHHDVLAAVERGISVVLCDHTNTERGYLPHLRDRLERELHRGIVVLVAHGDAEPLATV